MKQCLACGQEKELSDFYVQRDGKQGRQAICKTCSSARYYRPNTAVYVERSRARRANPEVRAKEREACTKLRHDAPLVRMFDAAKNRAKDRGIEFTIRREDLHLPAICPVLCIPMFMGGARHRTDNSPSIDRIDSSRGYVRGNVRVISWRANRLKSDGTLAEMQAIADYMERNLGIRVDPKQTQLLAPVEGVEPFNTAP